MRPPQAEGGRRCYGERAISARRKRPRRGWKMAAAKRSVLSSLAVYAEDSDPESDSEAGTAGSDGGAATGEKGGLVSVGYGDDDFTRLDGDEDGYEEEDDENSRQSEDDDSETEKPEAGDLKELSELEKRDPQELVASFSERVRNMSPDEIKIPPEPPGRCSNHLQDKIQKLYERKIKEGMDMNYIIQRKKEFRNPSIYEKLIQFCSIDELGTNYPKDMFDPHGWSEDSYYEALAKAQKIEMDKLEKAKKERTKIEFVTGTKKGTTTSATSTTTTTASTTVGDAQKRKSKWDSAIPVTTIAQPTILTTTATLPGVVTVTTSASGSKTTVISAVGTIVKKAKQ
ncbi:LOW QUALITY PROTEIN: SAP30-binding protein [Pezoporus wallicus]|uniref:LOW QUALITY PROTEIN: SAP30-binding protein n=1 Tax=Pezoporus wallicus TaxID=35540 RepID=UPI00254C347B|nr:LOW QUALITY PROTEIN: SAP30-binding protein [Pezoporus wallicus]XP_061317955.1 LOW QUALITY PROTEIN: SAP30-binding protein [Pezoporus flaviventris]